MQYLTITDPKTKVKAGSRYGRLTVLGATRRERDAGGRPLVVWHCRCDCGNEIETRAPNLLSGDTKSCGCYIKDITRQRCTTHGHSPRKANSRTYKAWSNMRSRCENPNVDAYPWYGGRGIQVCDAWRTFDAFLADMGECPKHMTIERSDPNGNYEPGNCVWASKMAQGGNKRNNRMLTAFGETLHLQEWCRRYGILQGTLWDRLDRGWPRGAGSNGTDPRAHEAVLRAGRSASGRLRSAWSCSTIEEVRSGTTFSRKQTY